MNLYTQAVDYIENYLNVTKPLLNEGDQQFPEVEGKLEFCVRLLKKNEEYQGDLDKVN